MKKLIASMIAVAFLMTGSMMAASAGTAPKATSTPRPAITTHVTHKMVKAKASSKSHNANKAGKTSKPVKPSGKKSGKKTVGK
jgi:hypothetical protein